MRRPYPSNLPGLGSWAGAASVSSYLPGFSSTVRESGGRAFVPSTYERRPARRGRVLARVRVDRRGDALEVMRPTRAAPPHARISRAGAAARAGDRGDRRALEDAGIDSRRDDGPGTGRVATGLPLARWLGPGSTRIGPLEGLGTTHAADFYGARRTPSLQVFLQRVGGVGTTNRPGLVEASGRCSSVPWHTTHRDEGPAQVGPSLVVGRTFVRVLSRRGAARR